MEIKKTSSLNFFIIFFLSYSFYTLQILTQELFHMFSKQSVIIICISYALLPITTFFICKIINKNKLKNDQKINFIFTIFTSIYLILTTIISLITITNIITIYYYQQTSLITLLIFISLPLIYIIFKGENNFFSLAAILLIIYILFKYSYINNYPKIDLYTFHNIFKIDKNNILNIILLSLPILIEPIILLNNQKNMSDKINTKLIIAFSLIVAIISIFTILRQTWEFGNLLNIINFPYLESIKNIIAGKFFENIDYYYLLSLSVSIFTRLGYTICSIKKSFNLNKKNSILILVLILLLVYTLQSNLKFYNDSIDKILLITSICLLINITILPFQLKRRKINV